MRNLKIITVALFTLTFVPTSFANNADPATYFKDKPKEWALAFAEMSSMGTACFGGKLDAKPIYDLKRLSGMHLPENKKRFNLLIEETTYQLLTDVYQGKTNKEKFCESAILKYGPNGTKIPGIFEAQ